MTTASGGVQRVVPSDAKAIQPVVRAMSVQQILACSGSANVLSGRTIHINLFGAKAK